jgi:hypothetical protein
MLDLAGPFTGLWLKRFGEFMSFAIRFFPVLTILFSLVLKTAYLQAQNAPVRKATLSPVKIEEMKAQKILAFQFFSHYELILDKAPFALARVSSYLATLGLAAEGPPYICRVTSDDYAQYFAGYAVGATVKGKGEITEHSLPAYKTLAVSNIGPWNLLDGVDAEKKWAGQQKLKLRLDLPHCNLVMSDALTVPDAKFELKILLPVY